MPSMVPVSQWWQLHQKDGSLQHQTVPIPDIKPNELLVKLQYTGVCHSDPKIQEGILGGHEGTGTVVRVGNLVTNFKIDDHVGIKFLHDPRDNSCDLCEQGHQKICPVSGAHVSASFQQYRVCKASEAVRIPRDMDMALAAPVILNHPLCNRPLHPFANENSKIMCAGVTAFKALQECDLIPGHIVAIVGVGSAVGILACHFAKARGCQVLAVSHGSKNRNMFLNDLGVYSFVDYEDCPDITTEIKSLTFGGPHAVIVDSISDTLLQFAIRFVRTSGTVVPVGLPPGGRLNADIVDIMARRVKIRGSWVAGVADTEKALQVVHEKKLQISHQVIHVRDLPLVCKKIQEGELVGNLVLDISQESCGSLRKGLPINYSSLASENWNIGTYLASRMETLGVKHYFAVPGDYNLHFLDELLKNENLQMIGCCNELNAGYAADGYARASPSGFAVVIITHMVGSLSVLNAIAGAYAERLKVVVINGCPKSADYDSNRIMHHTTGEVDKGQSHRIFKEVTCASVRLQPAPDIGIQLDAVLQQCIKNSLPVYIEVPRDTVQMTCLPPAEFTIPARISSKDRLAAAAELIRKAWTAAKNPVILIGGFTRLYLTKDTVSSFASKLGCAVFFLPDGKSHIRNSHPQVCGVFWSKASDPEVVTTVMESDLWVVIGGHWSDMHTVGSSIDLEKEQSRILNLEGDHVRMPDGTSIEEVALQEVIEEVLHSPITQNNASLKHFQLARGVTTNGFATPSLDSSLTVNQIVKGLERILNKDDIVLADTGDSWFHVASMSIPDGVDVHMQVLYASIGWGLPASLGSQIAREKKGRSILMIGDGAFQMTVQEVSTMIRMRSNAIIIILNNLGYQVETAIHDGPYNYIANWHYASLVTGMSSTFHTLSSLNPYMSEEEKEELLRPAMFSMKVQTYGDLTEALNRTQKESDKLAILECCVHPDDISRMLRRFGPLLHGNAPPVEEEEPHLTNRHGNGSLVLSKLDSPSIKSPLSSARLVIHSNGEENTQPVYSNTSHQDQYRELTDHMLTCVWTASAGWQEPKITRSTSIALSPTAPGLNYGIQCFEGMKAYRGYDGQLRLIRPMLNFKRLLSSARRVGLPDDIDVDELQRLIEALLRVDGPKGLPRDSPGSFLYIRPVFVATDASIGFRRPSEALLCVVFVRSPPFDHSSAMSLITSPINRCRAWPGGTGDAKVGGNYAPTIPTHKEATEAGYSQTLWLFGDDCQVTEAGANNFFVIWQSAHSNRIELVTAPLEDGIILPGVTRQNVLDLATEELAIDGHDGQSRLDVLERTFTMHEIVTASEEGRLLEAFTTGTAVELQHFICPVSRIYFRGTKDIFLPLAHGQPAKYTELIKTWLEDIMYGKVEHSWARIVDNA
ncbi:hypothetical protein UA08_08953 [Talaromyces atroroseus]|uniref:Pyruvate decarboxylase n=1 Tax=Talaromyces atroroseus TaxID=1441469 RepID=A0A225A606_TALAT|nr:hypothetical protein UA08_08953 [Talaromyces atroroseus]OKL55901.1 hypothetical protein UA08_08953 [Talaromyces atroroseus]